MGALGGVQAQAPFPIPVPASVVVVPLLALTLPLLLLGHQGDAARVRELQSRHDWAGLAELATRRLGRQPDDAGWHLLRGQALQMSQGCAAALPDFAAASGAAFGAPFGAPSDATRPLAPTRALDPGFVAGLALGICQLLDARWADAEHTMQRLAGCAADRWEPLYQLAWLRLRRGDAVAAADPLARLRELHPALADDLQRRPPRMPLPREMSAADGSAATETQMLLGARAVLLPAGRWTIVRERVPGVRGAGPVGPTGGDVEVPLQRLRARLDDGGPPVWLALTGNPAEAPGIGRWQVDAACPAEGALLAERYARQLDRPECLRVRALDTPDADAGATGPATGSELAGGAGYSIDYRRYGLGWGVQVTWWVPAERMPGHLAAAEWARMMAEAVRPLADGHAARPLPVLPR